MNPKLNKTQRILFLITVMLTNLAVMADNALYPITTNLYAAYPDSVGIMNYAVSGPQLLIVVASLITPLLLTKLSKKTLLCIGATSFTVGAVFGLMIDSALWFAATRTLIGLGQGVIQVVAVSLIGDVYIDEALRGKFVGYFSASQNAIGLVLSYLAGVLAAGSDWKAPYMLYYAAIPMLIMCFLCIPKLESADEAFEGEADASSDGKKGLGIECIGIIAVMFLIALCAMIVSYFISMYVAENALGDETVTGNAMTVASFVCIFIGAGFGAISKVLKNFVLPAACIIGIAAFALLAFVPSTFSCYAAVTLNMAAYVLTLTYAFARCPAVVPASKAALAVSLVSASYGAGGLLSTYATTFFMGLFKTELFTPILIAPMVIEVVALVIAFALSAMSKKNTAEA